MSHRIIYLSIRPRLYRPNPLNTRPTLTRSFMASQSAAALHLDEVTGEMVSKTYARSRLSKLWLLNMVLMDALYHILVNWRRERPREKEKRRRRKRPQLQMRLHHPRRSKMTTIYLLMSVFIRLSLSCVILTPPIALLCQSFQADSGTSQDA